MPEPQDNAPAVEVDQPTASATTPNQQANTPAVTSAGTGASTDKQSDTTAAVQPTPADGNAIWISAGAVLGGGLTIIVLLGALLVGISRFVQRRVFKNPDSMLAQASKRIHRSLRTLVVVCGALLGLGLVAGIGVLVWQGRDPYMWLIEQLKNVSAERWWALGSMSLKLLLAAVVLVIILRLIRGALRKVAAAAIAWEDLHDNDQSLTRFFTGLERCVVITAWLLYVVVAWSLLDFSERVGDWLLIIAKIYVIISVGLLVIRATAVVVDTLEGLSRRYAEKRDRMLFYDTLKPLVPLLRRCLEYALWIGTGSLVLAQLPTFTTLAEYGPKLMQAIGVFFLGRVGIEIGVLLLGKKAEATDGLDDMARRRRATLIPLAISMFRGGAYFCIFVLMLASLGFNPMPFLGGAAVLGMVVGFGAQSLITDVVSGFFIIFENVYLVGDYVEGGGAKGTVESIEFRTTRIRDVDGRLHIIRNGDMKQVINCSREYTKAVVPFDVSYENNVQTVFAILRKCGDELKQADPDVLGDLEIDGITGFGGATMTIRTALRVKPGHHERLAAALRLRFKEAFDEVAASGAPRKGLVPEFAVKPEAEPA